MSAPSLQTILNRRLLRTMILPAILFVLCTGAFVASRQYQQMKAQSLSLAQSLGQYMGQYLEESYLALQHLGCLAKNGRDGRDIENDLRNLHSTLPRFEQLLLVGPDRLVLASVPKGVRGEEFPTLFPEASGNPRLLVSHPMVSPATGHLTIFTGFVTPSGNRVIGELNLETMRHHLRMFTPADAGRTIIVADGFGNVIVHPDENMVRTQANIGGWSLLRNGPQREYAFGIRKNSGELFYDTMVRVPGTNWALIISSSFVSLFYPTAQTVLGLVLLQSAIFFLAMHLLRRKLDTNVIRPMAGFASLIKHATQGDYEPGPAMGPTESFAELAAMEQAFITMSREIARRERDLLASRRLIRGVIDSLPSVLVALDPEGCVTRWNAGAADLTGIHENRARGRYVLDLIPQLGPAAEAVTEALGKRRAMSLLKVAWREGEEIRYFDIFVYPLRDTPGAVLRLDDVTGRARMEEVMVQSEKMLSVGGLAAGMAHEINNPLGGVLQGVQNIERRLEPGFPANERAADELGLSLEAVRAYMERRGLLRMLAGIRSSGARAAGIVSNMLEFSRQSSSRMEPYDLHLLIETVLGLATSDYDLKKRYDFKRIRVERDFAPSMPPVPCSATEIEQVFFNLFKNAAHAMGSMADPPETPRIAVRTRVVDGHAEIRISDNGPGVPEGLRTRIFEPFFTTKQVGEGTGLGLSVSYFIITNNHGGSFTLDPEPGPGATFTIRLPLDPTA